MCYSPFGFSLSYTILAVYCIPLPVKVYLSHLVLLTFRLYFRLRYIAVYCIPLPVKVYLSHLVLLTFRLYFRLHYIAVYCIPLPVKVYLLHLMLLTFWLYFRDTPKKGTGEGPGTPYLRNKLCFHLEYLFYRKERKTVV